MSGVARKPIATRVALFVSTNFSIKQSKNGCEVYTLKNELQGMAPPLGDARQFAPGRGYGLLYDVHGVRLALAMRGEILSSGFPAWG